MDRGRTAIRWTALLLFACLALQLVPWPTAALFPAALSPFVAVCSAVAARAVGVTTLLGVPVLVLALLWRRPFCRYLCPTGLVLEYAGRIRRRLRTDTPVQPVSASVGQWLALGMLGAALLGYPFLLWLDPLAIFSATFGWLHRPLTVAAIAAASGLPLLVLLTLLWPNLWCGRLCPLGATQDLLAALRRAREPEGMPVNGARRSVLAFGAGALAGVALQPFLPVRRAVLRPPGALSEAEFAGVCVRCGNCVRACPTRILYADACPERVAGWLAPVVRFGASYCKADCVRCGEVCPSGAIQRVMVKEKDHAIIGRPKLEYDQCLLSSEKECSACQSACPYEAIQIVFDEKSYLSFPRVAAGKCNGCGACEVACPVRPKALVIVPRDV
jgi:ferredoxin-type protein NapF